MKTELPALAAELRTTDRTLRRALNEGLLRARRPSPRTVDITLGERSYLRNSWHLLSRLRDGLRTEPSISLAVLFGSRATGDHRPDSDVDLLVALRKGGDPRRVAARLSDRLGLRVQLVTLEDAERAPRLLLEVIQQGRVIVDRDGAWPSLLARRARVERAAARERSRIESDFTAAFGGEPRR